MIFMLTILVLGNYGYIPVIIYFYFFLLCCNIFVDFELLVLLERILNEKLPIVCREHARCLALENEVLQNQVLQTEKDTIDVVGYLKRQDEEKDMQVSIWGTRQCA